MGDGSRREGEGRGDAAPGAPMDGFTAFLRTTPDPDAAAALSVATLGDMRIRDRTGSIGPRNAAPRLSGAPNPR